MQVGPYRILEELGRGGMGVVYRAADASGRMVALKALRAERAGNPAVRRRFVQELRALAKLRHPNLVSLLDAGEHAGAPWIALEFVEGSTLEEHLRGGPVSIPRAVWLATQLARGLGYVHSRGVLHRDVKPANVLLRGEQVLLTDFGLALDEDLSGTRLTATGAFLGTPGYWAPEQARGEKHRIGPTTDVYGLGAVLFACLSGEPPVRVRSLQELVEDPEGQRAPPLRELRPDVPRWLAELCERCLAADPQARFATPGAVLAALQRGEVEAPASARGSPWVAVVGGLLLLALGTGAWAFSAGEEDPPAPTFAGPQRGPAQAFLAQGRGLLVGQQLGFAEDVLSVARELDPGDAWVCATRAKVRARSGRKLAADADAAAARNLAPNDPGVLSDLAWLTYFRGQHAQALSDAERALRADPESASALGIRARALRDLGRADEAGAAFREALRVSPDTGWLHRDLAALSLVQQDLDAAKRHAQRALELAPRLGGTHSILGYLLAGEGRHEEAVSHFDDALRLQPSAVQARASRGRSLRRLKRYEEALADANACIRQDPSKPRFYLDRADVLFWLRDDPACAADLEHALKLDPSLRNSRSELAMTYLRLGKPDLAREQGEALLARFPDGADGPAVLGMVAMNARDYERALALFERALEQKGPATSLRLAERQRTKALLELGR